MAFVPIVPHDQPPSPRARDLGNRLAEVIETFQRQYPGTSPQDIRQAMRLATPANREVLQRKASMVVGLLAVLLAGLIAALSTGGGGAVKGGLPPFGIMALLIGVLVVVVALRLRR